MTFVWDFNLYYLHLIVHAESVKVKYFMQIQLLNTWTRWKMCVLYGALAVQKGPCEFMRHVFLSSFCVDMNSARIQ